jgi:hypothetical protein
VKYWVTIEQRFHEAMGVDEIAKPGSLVDGLRGTPLEEPEAPLFIPIIENIIQDRQYSRRLGMCGVNNHPHTSTPIICLMLYHKKSQLTDTKTRDSRLCKWTRRALIDANQILFMVE